MEKQPAFLRGFSKENSSEERNQAAKEIKQKRKEYFDRKVDQGEKQEKKDEVVRELETLAGNIESYQSTGFFQKVKDYFAIQKTKAELNAKMGIVKSLEDQLTEVESGRPELDEARQMMKRFYDGEKRKWTDAPYSKEDIAENFTEEHLASLSIEDYVLLMKRFPGQMVTHISRHGVRDHFGMFEHHGGMGEWHGGFQKMLSSKRLLSPLGVALSQAETNHDICKFLNGGKEVVTNRDAIENDKESMGPRGPVMTLKRYEKSENFHNKAAIHLAVEKVLNGIYGNERGNEVFIIYPSAHVASQYMFKNPGYDLLNPQDAINAAHNDVYVWNKWKKGEEVGMAIDAGVVFLPENAVVDTETGSLYQLDEAGNPIPEDTPAGINQLNFEKTHQGIPSKEYWETYFAKHPESRPSKIVYYDARMTPTDAMWKWKVDNGIVNKKDAVNLGFLEHQVGMDLKRPFGEQEMNDFRQLAMNALVEEYGALQVLFEYDPSVVNSPIAEWGEKAQKMYAGSERAV